MSTLDYLQLFEGLAEKYQGSFSLTKTSSKICQLDISGHSITHVCQLDLDDKNFRGDGESRKEALKALYRKLRGLLK